MNATIRIRKYTYDYATPLRHAWKIGVSIEGGRVNLEFESAKTRRALSLSMTRAEAAEIGQLLSGCSVLSAGAGVVDGISGPVK